MSLTISNFEKVLEKNFLYEDNPKIAVGVSGGPDSLALVVLLHQWIIKKNGYLIALIVDHRIRAESFSESLQTKNFLIGKSINSKILFVNRKKVKNQKLSQARINRFEKLLNYCQNKNIFHLFLGHHFDDNLETFILRKIAGSNFEGLNSMQFKTILGNTQILRPLLFYSKKEILLFNKKLNLPYISDPSNLNTKFTRVAVRKYLRSNQRKKKEINNEFEFIRNNYYLYKKMIYQVLNLITIEAKFKKLIFSTKDLFCLNSEFKKNILIKAMKYVNNSDFQIRSKKVEYLLSRVSKFQNISLKTNKTLISRIDEKIIIFKR